MSRLLAAQRAWTVPGWVKDLLWRRARAIPSLDLRFADSKSLVDAVTGASLVTFTRASSGTFVDSAGVLQTAATDVPRFDHNPTTGESLGLLVEEQRTNSIRNNTMVGAVAGTPGTNPTNWLIAATQTGLSKEIVGTGTENGISYIDVRIFGTATASDAYTVSFDSAVEVVASTGQTWTGTVYTRIVGGSTTGITATTVRVRERTIVGAVLGSTTSPLTNLANLKDGRVAVTRVLSDALAARVTSDIAINYTNGAAIDITLRIGLPQLEQGAFATSAIPTTTAAATRSADVASITGTAFSGWYRQDEGTLLINARDSIVFPSSVRHYADLNPNNLTSTIGFIQSNSGYTGNGQNIVAAVAASNVIQATIDLNAQTAEALRVAVTYKANSFSACRNGVLGTPDTSGSLPTPDRLSIGSAFNSTRICNSTIARLAYWPQALPSQLQALTQ